MKLLTEELRRLLLKNSATLGEVDHTPLVRVFDPAGAAAWLFTEMMASGDGKPDILFGLCDLGFGYPELGYVSLAELEAVRARLGIGLERDFHFQGRAPLSFYAEAARLTGRITETPAALNDAARRLKSHWIHRPPARNAMAICTSWRIFGRPSAGRCPRQAIAGRTSTGCRAG